MSNDPDWFNKLLNPEYQGEPTASLVAIRSLKAFEFLEKYKLSVYYVMGMERWAVTTSGETYGILAGIGMNPKQVIDFTANLSDDTPMLAIEKAMEKIKAIKAEKLTASGRVEK